MDGIVVSDFEVLRFPGKALRQFASEVFRHDGVPERDAVTAAEVLCTADEWGIRSHGLARLRSYHELITAKRINPAAKVRIVREHPSVVTVDADNGLGLVVAPAANQIAIERAESTGSAWVSVFNSNHFGIAGYYAVQGLERDLIGVAMTNTPPLVTPLWGAKRMLGTNPMAYAFPAHEEPPVVIDMATSAITLGCVETAARSGDQLPDGCLIDKNGEPSRDPRELFSGGMLLPLGGARDTGGHKGYCLATVVDLLCGPLAGACWGPFVSPFPMSLTKLPERSVGNGVGHLFGAYSIAAFADPLVFRRRVDEWVRTIRLTAARTGTSGPMIPGDPERQSAVNSRLNGVELDHAVVRDLEHLGDELEIHFP